MAKTKERYERRWRLDPDLLASFVAFGLGTLVMAVCFFARRGLTGPAVAVRVGVTVVAAYVATFLLVLFLRHVAQTELSEKKERKGRRSTGIQQEAPPEAAVEAVKGPGPSEDTGRRE